VSLANNKQTMETLRKMMKMNKNKKGQAGFVITTELLLITAILILGLVTGWAKLRDQSVAELADLGSAIGAIDQGYSVDGFAYVVGGLNTVAVSAGWSFQDTPDTGAANNPGGDAGMIFYTPPPAGAFTYVPSEQVDVTP
jgi:hypothetical protein